MRLSGLNRTERRRFERRFRKEQKRSVPSPTAVFRYLSLFHDPEQEKLRLDGKAFIPAPNEYLRGFRSVCRDMVSFAQQQDLQETATLNMDATLVENHKAEAFYRYKKFPGYQPFNVWWAEQEMILHTEFRDGNVSAGYEQFRILKEALALLLIHLAGRVVKRSRQLFIQISGHHPSIRLLLKAREKIAGLVPIPAG